MATSAQEELTPNLDSTKKLPYTLTKPTSPVSHAFSTQDEHIKREKQCNQTIYSFLQFLAYNTKKIKEDKGKFIIFFKPDTSAGLLKKSLNRFSIQKNFSMNDEFSLHALSTITLSKQNVPTFLRLYLHISPYYAGQYKEKVGILQQLVRNLMLSTRKNKEKLAFDIISSIPAPILELLLLEQDGLGYCSGFHIAAYYLPDDAFIVLCKRIPKLIFRQLMLKPVAFNLSGWQCAISTARSTVAFTIMLESMDAATIDDIARLSNDYHWNGVHYAAYHLISKNTFLAFIDKLNLNTLCETVFVRADNGYNVLHYVAEHQTPDVLEKLINKLLEVLPAKFINKLLDDAYTQKQFEVFMKVRDQLYKKRILLLSPIVQPAFFCNCANPCANKKDCSNTASCYGAASSSSSISKTTKNGMH